MKPRKAIDKAVLGVRKGMDTAIKAAASTESEATKRNRAAMEEVMDASGYTRGYKRR